MQAFYCFCLSWHRQWAYYTTSDSFFVFFFFSSRRRHTRYWRDWSSDVCSSDLGLAGRMSTFRNVLLIRLKDVEYGAKFAWIIEVTKIPKSNPATSTTGREEGQIGRASCRERV